MYISRIGLKQAHLFIKKGEGQWQWMQGSDTFGKFPRLFLL